MTTAGLAILILLGSVLIWIVIELGKLPGAKAHERNHPQAEAINILGWLGLFLGGVGWVVALVWAYTKPPLVIVVAESSPQEIGAAVQKALTSDPDDRESNA